MRMHYAKMSWREVGCRPSCRGAALPSRAKHALYTAQHHRCVSITCACCNMLSAMQEALPRRCCGQVRATAGVCARQAAASIDASQAGVCCVHHGAHHTHTHARETAINQPPHRHTTPAVVAGVHPASDSSGGVCGIGNTTARLCVTHSSAWRQLAAPGMM
jgi:hypothetical protein